MFYDFEFIVDMFDSSDNIKNSFEEKQQGQDQLTSIISSQLHGVMIKKEWDGLFLVPEFREKVLNQLLNSRVVWLTQKWDAIIEISPEDDSPELKNEIYRLVEKSFESVWWNTGKWIKTDHYNDESFKQLVVVKNTGSEHLFLSGYRYSLLSSSVNSAGELNTPMWNFFNIDEDSFKKLKDGNAIELWTAWVNKEIWRVAIYGLHWIWDWLVYLHDKYQNKYFIWKMTIPSEDSPESYSAKSRDFSVWYMDKFYSSGEFSKKIQPKAEFIYSYKSIDSDMLNLNWNFSADEKNLKEILRYVDPENAKWLFPNMFPIYLDRINTLDYIWTVKNGNVCESGIIVDCDQIKEDVIGPRQKNLYDWVSKFGNQKVSYWEYLKLAKSL